MTPQTAVPLPLEQCTVPCSIGKEIRMDVLPADGDGPKYLMLTTIYSDTIYSE